MGQIEIKKRKLDINEAEISQRNAQPFQTNDTSIQKTATKKDKLPQQRLPFNFSLKFILFLVFLIILAVFVLWLKSLGQIFNLHPQKDQLIHLLEQGFSEIGDSFQNLKQAVPQTSSQSSVDEKSDSQILDQEQIETLKNKILEKVSQ